MCYIFQNNNIVNLEIIGEVEVKIKRNGSKYFELPLSIFEKYLVSTLSFFSRKPLVSLILSIFINSNIKNTYKQQGKYSSIPLDCLVV